METTNTESKNSSGVNVSSGLYPPPSTLTPLCLWAAMGDEGNVMCFDCNSSSCFGCVAAWRRIDGKVEYYRPAIHGHCKA